ncbi:MAG: TonB-dependent receptor plug domain-containing protein, partial [bacterium]
MSRPTLKPWLLLAYVAAIGALPTAIRAQSEIRISGIVRDLNTHREISNANIFIKGTQRGTVSDFAGRYELRVPYHDRKVIVVFQHIAYEPREMSVDSVAATRYVYLQPRVISLGIVTVEGETAQRPEIAKDLPQTVSLVEAKNFEIRGYVDAGDLLRTDHSVQVEEELSGKKTVAIRGGNADEVIVLYNGVKLNSTFDNEFDLSLIDLEDIERFEVIKGSNT